MGSRKVIRKKVNLNQIVFDEDLYPRIQVSWQTVFDYSESMKTGVEFPPITLAFFNKQLILVDGAHRLKACKNLKLKNIKAEVLIGLNRKQIFIKAVERNISHGRILSPYEKRRIALKLRKLKYKDIDISNLIQVPMEKLDNFIEQRLINSITGETIITKTPLKHLAGGTFSGAEISSILKAQMKLSIQDQLHMLTQFRDLLRSSLIDFDNKKISNLLAEIKTRI